jgi:RNA polymerase sigma-70 factor, ECF subfamily
MTATSVPEPSDEELVRRIQGGDAVAVAALFERHLPPLRAHARRALPTAAAAVAGESEVVRDAWLGVLTGLPDFRDRAAGSFGRWLLRIVDERIADELRRHGTEPRAHEFADDDARLREAIAGLPPDWREAMRWMHDEGLSAAETAARMNRSAEAVRKLYARALGRLADRLARTAADG